MPTGRNIGPMRWSLGLNKAAWLNPKSGLPEDPVGGLPGNDDGDEMERGILEFHMTNCAITGQKMKGEKTVTNK
jgi:hypothetical protein